MDTWTGADARRLRKVALRMSLREFADHLGVSDRTVSKWEQAGAARQPRPHMQAILDTALAQADDAAKARFTQGQPSSGALEHNSELIGVPDKDDTGQDPIAGGIIGYEANAISGLLDINTEHAPLTGSYFSELRANISSIVHLDNKYGGVDLVRLSERLFRSVQQKLSTVHDPATLSDLCAALGELAEVTGWLAYDANRHDLVRTMNQESLYYSRLAGDRSTELLTLQNASMHAGAMGRPSEALQIANSVLESDDHLSPRVRALFLTRRARALAQSGDASAISQFEQIRSLYLDGTTESDPAWAWWIDDRELAWHEGMALRDVGQHGHALELFARSVEATPETEVRSQFLHRAYLLQAQLDVRSWNDAETSIPRLAHLSAEVGSPRTTTILRASISEATRASTTPRGLVDSVKELDYALDQAVGNDRD